MQARQIRRLYTRHRRAIVIVLVILVLETFFHIGSYRVQRPAEPLDAPFSTGCREPPAAHGEKHKENAAIIMLARNSDLMGAQKAVASIEKQFNRWYHYPIIFFNDKPWDHAFIEALTKTASGPVHFETIERKMWSYPEWIDQDRAREEMKRFEKKGLPYAGIESYHHMCRYNSGLFYDHKALKPYKWFWRIEPDVQYTCAITYDPFAEMAKRGKKYGFTIALWEVGSTSPSLFRKVADYKDRRRIASTGLWNAMVDASWAPLPIRPFLSMLHSRDKHGDAWNFCHYWSNFEIADLDFFRSEEYRDFFNMLDVAGGFYYERWGDAPVHSLAAALFLQPSEIHYFQDIGYMHPPFQHCPGNAPGKQMPNSAVLGSGLWQPEAAGGIGCRCDCDPNVGKVPDTCLNNLMQPLG